MVTGAVATKDILEVTAYRGDSKHLSDSRWKKVALGFPGRPYQPGTGLIYIPCAGSASDVSSATSARNSLLGLNTGTGRAATSTGSPVRGFLAMRVFRRRILKVP